MGRPSKYPAEFRYEAVQLNRSSDRPRCQVAESLGISDGPLAAWVKEAEGSEIPDALCRSSRVPSLAIRANSSGENSARFGLSEMSPNMVFDIAARLGRAHSIIANSSRHTATREPASCHD